jgi:hypothetical protein
MAFSIVQAIKDWLLEHNVKKLTAHEQAVIRKNLAKGIDILAQQSKSESASDVDEEFYTSREHQLIVDTEEEAERKANSGTAFTIDLFTKWKVKFDKERKEQEEKESKELVEDTEKLNRITGKKYFERRAAMHFGAEEDLEEKGKSEKKGLFYKFLKYRILKFFSSLSSMV